VARPNGVSYVATMQTVRQVKTVFVIFIAFVCCWSPYIVVLLYDSTDSLSLPVHLFTSMLAHLHASLNFAIYGLMNPNLRAGFAAHLSACCCRATTSDGSTLYLSYDGQPAVTRQAGYGRGVYVDKTLVAVEYYQLQEMDRNGNGCNVQQPSRQPFSV